MLEITALETGYGGRKVLKGVSLKVAPGEVVALIGPNGSGKTTLIRAASGFLPGQAGTVKACGKDIAKISPSRRASLISVVPQARDLPEHFTVHQTVLLGRTPHLGWMGILQEKDLERVRWALERTETAVLAERKVSELSGGEQQLVLLARAIAQDTPVLLLDEPTSHLDLRHQSQLLNLVKELAQEQGLAVLMALHDLNLAALYSDRVALLVEGKLASVGTPGEVLKKENLELAYKAPVSVIRHPQYGTPLVLPDGRW